MERSAEEYKIHLILNYKQVMLQSAFCTLNCFEVKIVFPIRNNAVVSSTLSKLRFVG
jgi:hypothetical protein